MSSGGNVELEFSDISVVKKTKAALVDQSIEMRHYILGNEINQLIEHLRKQPSLVNAVITRSQAKCKNERAEKTLSEGRDGENPLLVELKDEGEIDFP